MIHMSPNNRQNLLISILIHAIFASLVACKADVNTSSATPMTATITRDSNLTTPSPPPKEPATFTPVATQKTLTHRDSPATITPIATSTAIPPIVLAIIGDYGLAGPIEAEVANLVHSWAPDAIATTGDNNYPNGEARTIDDNIGQYYADFIHPYQGDYGPGAIENHFFPSPGNHDWNSDNLAPYLEYFMLPGNERYYDVRLEALHLFIIDSDSREPDGVSADSIQARWLQTALTASDAHWKIIVMHHSPYSSGQHGSVKWMRWPFAEWGATAVIAGHDHVYERMMIDGFPYFINGLGGSPNRYIFLLPLPGSEVRFRTAHGAMRLQATSRELLFEFVTVNGEIIDTYRLSSSS
jgi:tartrate-resistant acid phosphatase type 5